MVIEKMYVVKLKIFNRITLLKIYLECIICILDYPDRIIMKTM